MGPSRENVVRTLQQLKDVPRTVSAADAAIASVILHWSDGSNSLKQVSKLLNLSSPVTAFLSLESKQGDPDADSENGTFLSKQKPWFQIPESGRGILNQRVEAVRLLFESQPELLTRLRELKFNFATGELTEEKR